MWGTITFRAGRFSARAGRRAAERWSGKLTGLDLAVWVLEPHKSGGMHQHWLLRFRPPEPHPSQLWAQSFERYGRSHFDRMGSGSESALKADYVAKYVSKMMRQDSQRENWDVVVPTDVERYRPEQQNLWR